MNDSHVNSIESRTIYGGQRRGIEAMTPPSLPALTNEELQRARDLSRYLQRSDDQLDDIVVFGNDAQAALAQLTKNILDGVRVNSLDDVILLSDGVLTQINALSLVDLAPAARRYLWLLHESTAAINHRIKKFFRGFELVNTRIQQMEGHIFDKESESTQRYYADIELGNAAFDVLLDARIKLAAIELFLCGDYGYVELEKRQQRVAEEKQAAARENRPVDFVILETAERYARYIERLEERKKSLSDLIVSAYQARISIRMLQDNENTIRQKLSDIRMDLLPQWRLQITLAYQAYQQRGITGIVEQINRANDELKRRVGDQLEETAIEISRIKTMPTTDPDAMIYFHDKLVNSLEIIKTASIEAKKIRDDAEALNQLYIKKLSDAVSRSVDGN